MESRELLPHEESDEVLLQRTLKQFYRMLSDFEYANECFIAAECFRDTPVCRQGKVTYPLEFLLAQVENAREDRALDIRVNQHDPANKFDRRPYLMLNTIMSEYITDPTDAGLVAIQKYVGSLSPEMHYLLGFVEWTCSSDLRDLLRPATFQDPECLRLDAQQEDMRKELKLLAQDRSPEGKAKHKALYDELGKMGYRKGLAYMAASATMNARANRIMAMLFQQLDLDRVHQCMQRINYERPEFRKYVKALTRLETFDTQGDEGKNTRKAAILKQVHDMRLRLESKYGKQSEPYYRQLQILCTDLYTDLAEQRELDAHAGILVTLSILKTLTKYKHADIISLNPNSHDNNNNSDANVVLPGLFVDLNQHVAMLREFFGIPLEPKIVEVETEEGDIIRQPEPISYKKLINYLIPLLTDANRHFVLDNTLLENLQALANEQRFWERYPDGLIIQKNLFMMITVLNAARIRLMWENTHETINHLDVNLEDANHMLRHCAGIVQDEIQGATAAGNPIADLVNRLEDLEEEAHEVNNNQQLSDSDKCKEILRIARAVSAIPVELAGKAKKKSEDPDMMEQHQSVQEMLQLFNDDLPALNLATVTELLENAKQHNMMTALGDTGESVCFMHRCLQIIEDPDLSDQQKKMELLNYLLLNYEFKQEMRFNMNGCDLSGCRIVNLIRHHVMMNNANLCKVTFSGCTLHRPTFVGADLTGTTFNNCKLVKANFDYANMVGLSCVDTSFADCSMHCTVLIDFSKKYSMDEWNDIFTQWDKWQIPASTRSYNLESNLNNADGYSKEERAVLSEMAVRGNFSPGALLSNSLFAPAPKVDKKGLSGPPQPK